jgi:hypothetical protein
LIILPLAFLVVQQLKTFPSGLTLRSTYSCGCREKTTILFPSRGGVLKIEENIAADFPYILHPFASEKVDQ